MRVYIVSHNFHGIFLFLNCAVLRLRTRSWELFLSKHLALFLAPLSQPRHVHIAQNSSVALRKCFHGHVHQFWSAVANTGYGVHILRLIISGPDILLSERRSAYKEHSKDVVVGMPTVKTEQLCPQKSRSIMDFSSNLRYCMPYLLLMVVLFLC